MLLQAQINAQSDIQAGGRLAVDQVVPPDAAGRIPLQTAQVRIERGFQPGLPIDRIGVAGDGSQVRVGIATSVIGDLPLGEINGDAIPVKQAAAFT